MPIGPVDFQPIMPKVNEIARSQSELQSRIVGGEQQQAESSIRRADQNTKSVHQQDEANKAVITEKEKEKNKKNRQQAKGREGGGEKPEAKKKNDGLLPRERHTIDIRL